MSMHDEARGKKRSVENDNDNGGGNDRSKARRTSQYSHSQYTVGWVCALPKEQTAAIAMLDEQHESLLNPHSDPNAYTLGSIGDHNIVIACLPKGQIGTASAATVATRMVQTFPCVKFGLMVGIGGGVPRRGIDVRLGDVVVGTPTGSFGGVVQWDMGKAREGGRFERTGALNAPPPSLLSALTKIETRHAMHEPRIPKLLEDMFARWPKLAPLYSRSEELVDVLFRADYGHVDKSEVEPDEEEDDIAACRFCDKTKVKARRPPCREMMIHYGLIASGNQVIKDAKFRDQLNTDLGGEVLCIEMEAAGLLTNFPCLIVRGICDYADSHKNKTWQEHAAAVAAAFAKELLLDHVQPEEVNRAPTALEHLAEQVQEVFDSVTQFHSEMLLNQDVDAVKWLSVTDYASIQRDHFEKAHQGTCQWFLNSPEYWLWQHSSGSTLYCPGIPGAGKTILASIVINDVVNKFQDDGVGIAYIYFSYERRGEQNLDHVLSCLLKQLAQTALNQSRLPESVRELVNKHWRWGTRPSFSELFQTLQSICAVFSSVFILIDALDECQAHVLSSLVSKLPELQTKVEV
ncbi:ankyrin repeat protein [Colletotrichum plurivorum]|uniref:Ankyrin repeat protein n=1 Tax=Colletotrichum plurivorum TaxID=2175906 RepID=A0A8H6JM07_9PEZI|nr:ankyrin repeat protein [Colletotrichum plurivorum]